ncbi:MAG: 16S rRNA (uracil(1498)-N(3))-methyltransferase [Chlamydiia bacterium]|nr:16S rRNA (uracil(1498)-N(3))-methyltransferase [Chlamydiia bacterium]
MPDNRFYLPQNLETGSICSIKEQELHHLQHVMRVKEEETIELINGKGQLATGVVQKLERHQASVLIETVISETVKRPTLILAQAMPRIARLEYIVEKATELGVTEIWLFPSTHSEKKEYSPSNIQRLNQILVASLKQSGRLFMPEIVYKKNLTQWTPLSIPAFFGDTAPDAPNFLEVLEKQENTSSLWMVGPESGFTVQESDFIKGSLSITGVSLNPNILRVDTAAIAGLAILSIALNKD